MNALCGVPRCHRRELAEGLCTAHFARLYGPLGLDDMPPRWAIVEDTPMTAQTATFECEGWYDSNGSHHACTNDAPKPGGKGRCTRCYSREYAANNGKVRPPQERPALSLVSVPACIGWEGSNGTHHDCAFAGDRPGDDGRCQRCARMQRGAEMAASMVAEAPKPTPPAPEPAPQIAQVPILRPHHVRPVTSYAIACANCDAPLVQGDEQTIASYVGKALACRDCGAAWRVEASTLGHHERRETAA